MQRRFALMLGAALAVGCSSVTDVGPERTFLIEFDYPPTGADAKELSRRGAQVTLAVQVVQGLLVRSAAEKASFDAIPGVASVKDLSLDADPVVAVFIHMMSPPTEADVELVARAGGMGASCEPSSLLITAHMRVSALDGVLPLGNVAYVNVYANTVTLA
ncbi:MAG: hypothetical protein ACYC6F_12650 [Longimicrobiales bacterium]